MLLFSARIGELYNNDLKVKSILEEVYKKVWKEFHEKCLKYYYLKT